MGRNNDSLERMLQARPEWRLPKPPSGFIGFLWRSVQSLDYHAAKQQGRHQRLARSKQAFAAIDQALMGVHKNPMDTLVREVDFLTIADSLKLLNKSSRYFMRLSHYRSPLWPTISKDIKMLVEARLVEKFLEKHARTDPEDERVTVFADEKNSVGGVVATPAETWFRIRVGIEWDIRGSRLAGVHESVRNKLLGFNALDKAEGIQQRVSNYAALRAPGP